VWLLLVAALSLPSGIGGWVGVYFWRLFSMMVYDLILCGGGMAGSAVLQGLLPVFSSPKVFKFSITSKSHRNIKYIK